MAQHGHLTREEKKEIRIGRRKLRKELKQSGITSRKEFEKIAQMLGLVYGDDSPWLLWWWWRFWEKALGLGLLKWLMIGAGFLGMLFLYAAISNQKGNFTVTVCQHMQTRLAIGNDPDVDEERIRLNSDVLKEVNAFTIQDLPDNLNQIDGSHNLDNVVAYTFYVRNKSTSEVVDANWYLVLNDSTLNLDQGVWAMIYDEDKMRVYTRPNRQTGEAEVIEGCITRPLYEQAADPDAMYYVDENGYYGVKTIPYEENRVVASGTIPSLAPGEVHKYTVVLWVELYDPDVEEISMVNEETGEVIKGMIGGHAGYSFRITDQDADTEAGKECALSSIRYSSSETYTEESGDGWFVQLFRKLLDR